MVRLILLYCLLFLLLIASRSECETISGPDVKQAGSDIYVSFSLGLENKGIQELREGIDKEFKFFIDLFRIWKIWPDEFVIGKTYTRTLRADPIKKEYIGTSSDGSELIERRFRSFESMLEWTLSLNNLKLTNTRELEPGQYFVRVTIESKVRKLPPLVRQFVIFVSENDFKIRKDSGPVTIEVVR